MTIDNKLFEITKSFCNVINPVNIIITSYTINNKQLTFIGIIFKILLYLIVVIIVIIIVIINIFKR